MKPFVRSNIGEADKWQFARGQLNSKVFTNNRVFGRRVTENELLKGLRRPAPIVSMRSKSERDPFQPPTKSNAYAADDMLKSIKGLPWLKNDQAPGPDNHKTPQLKQSEKH